jgi:hypothetical protein
MSFRLRVPSVRDLPPALQADAEAKLRQLDRSKAEAPAGGESAAPGPATPAKGGNKFGAEPKTVDGLVFKSKWQADRYVELRNLERAGLISKLRVEVPYALEVARPTGEIVRLGSYIADADYYRGDEFCVEDSKSKPTRKLEMYLWKKAHFEVQYGIRLIETERYKPRFGAGGVI